MILAPQLATPIDLPTIGTYVVSEDWYLEQKLDGHRVMLINPGTPQMRAVNRNGDPYTHRIPTAIQNWRLPAGVEEHFISRVVLDGELVDGQFWAFDLLLQDGNFHRVTLEGRRLVLEQLLTRLQTPFGLVPQARTTAEKESLLLQAANQRLEGVVAKRREGRYLPGRRSQDWLKAKFVVTADVVVIGVRDDGKDSVSVGITTDSGLSFRAVGRCSLIGKPEVKVGDVVEVRYLYVPDRSNPRLFQPTLVRVRRDKNVAECDGSDLKYTNKSVITAL